MAAKKHKAGAADPPLTPPPTDLPDGFRMVEVEPGRWIGLPTFDINEWFDSCEIPSEERAGILERGGGYDGFQVSADLERETFKWLLEHGRPAVSTRTPLLSDETMADVARRFRKRPLLDKAVQDHLRRLDIRDELQRQAEVKAWSQPENRLAGVNGQAGKNDSDLDREFMERAVEEARKSIAEDDRAHPKVGVVVVKDGKELAVAYRGELAKGDHAEFTALEKKLKDVEIAGATVYATLEPCTTRNHPKLPCAVRLAERKVNRVVIGMLDLNPDISGKGVQRLREANIAVALFHPDLMAKIEEMNREFIRHHKNAAPAASSDSGGAQG